MKIHYPIIIILLLGQLCPVSFLRAQTVAISNDGSAPDPSALLDVKSTTKGFLPPRMNSAQRAAITSPAAGLIVFDTDRKGLFLYDSTGWKILQAVDPNSADSYASQQFTIPPDIVSGSDFYADQLGTSVAMYGGYAFIGAKGAYNRSGYVLVYKRTGDTWSYFQVINPPAPVNNMGFGTTLRAKENYLFVGSPAAPNAGAVICGAVYIFIFNGSLWAYQSRLLPSAAVANGAFGTYLDANTNADQLAVYGPGNNLVNIFKRTGTSWGLPQAITSSNIVDVAMQPDGDAIAFGVVSNSETINAVNYTRPGHVNLYTKSGSLYSFAVTIINPQPQSNDRFGSKLKFGDNYGNLDYILLVGSSNQLQIGSIAISNPATYYFTGSYNKVFNGGDGFGFSPITKADPHTSNFEFSGTTENFLVGDNERIGIYSSGASAAWFAEKGANVKLPETVSYINFGTAYSLDAWASSTDAFVTQPTYFVVGTPYANDGKGAFYFLKF